MARPRSDELVAACGGTVVTVAARLLVERADPAGRGGNSEFGRMAHRLDQRRVVIAGAGPVVGSPRGMDAEVGVLYGSDLAAKAAVRHPAGNRQAPTRAPF